MPKTVMTITAIMIGANNAEMEIPKASPVEAIVFHLNKFKEEFIKMKNYNRNQD